MSALNPAYLPARSHARNSTNEGNKASDVINQNKPFDASMYLPLIALNMLAQSKSLLNLLANFLWARTLHLP